MKSSEEHTPARDPYKRIEELESHVKELSVLVEDLLAVQEKQPHAKTPRKRRIARTLGDPSRIRMVDGVREGVGRALGGEEGESLESRIGAIWFSRFAGVITITFVVVVAATTLGSQAVLPLHKIIAGYAFAIGLFAYGIHPSNRQNLFAQTMLGCGLAILYFTTYAAFFIDTARVFENTQVAIPALAGCLVFLALVCHYLKNQTAAGISLFLIYYTVVLGLWENPSQDAIVHSLVTCAMVSVVALVFHLTHRWLMFTWAALIGTHLTYIYFFWAKPPALDLSAETYFWVSNGYLTLSYIVFSLACITDARKTGEYRKTVAPMAGVNSFVFLVLTWFSVREIYPDGEWAFRLCIAALLGIFALYAEVSGPKRNYLFQIFIAKTVVMFTLALQAYLSHEWLLVAMALECLGLGFSYKRSGSAIFKLLGLGLLGITFVGCILAVRIPGEAVVLSYTVPANWFSSVGVAFVFCIVAFFYEHFVRRPKRSERVVSSQWFLSDTFIDVSGHTASMFHAAAAALILLSITILDVGSNPALPYILSGEAILMVLLGLFMQTASVEVASVLLLIAAHVCYHVFLFLDKPGFEEQDSYALYTVMVALLTYLGGYLWERYIRGVRAIQSWEDDALSSIPYLASTFMLATLMQRGLTPVYVPLGHAGLAVVLFTVCGITRLRGLRIAAIFALAAAAISFYTRLYNPGDSIAMHPDFLLVMGLVWGAFTVSERLMKFWRPEYSHRTGVTPLLRTLTVVIAAALTVLGLWQWSPERYVTFYWAGLVVVTMALGVGFREARYRWVAMVLVVVATLRAYAYDLTNLLPLYKYMSFGALALLLGAISWGYSKDRGRTASKIKGDEGEAPTVEG